MFAVPLATPVMIPDEAPTVATAPLLVLQVPPAGVADTVVVMPGQIDSVPVIGPGGALTVTIFVW
jgi:hypothetical protein